jgi:hypothetical protein
MCCLGWSGCDRKTSPSPAEPTAPASQPVTTGPAPRIEVAEPIFDLGQRWSTEPSVKHDFVVKNTGQVPLHIKGVVSSCGCTHVGKKNVTLEPDKTWNLSVELDLSKQQQLAMHRITVLSDDPQQPKLELKIRGVIRKPITMMPFNGMFFGKVKADERRERVLAIRNHTDDAMDLKIVRCAGQTFTAKIDSVKPGKEYKLTMTARPPYKPGVNTGRIDLTTGIKLQPKLVIRPQAFSPPRLLVTPNPLTLPKSLPNGAKRTISVRNNGPKDVKVLRATCSIDGVTAEVRSAGEGKVHNVIVRFPSGLALPIGGGEITIHTDDEESPQLKVRVNQQGTPPAGSLK